MATNQKIEIDCRALFEGLRGFLGEHHYRLAASLLAKIVGNISLAAQETGLSRPTLYSGLKELSEGPSGHELPPGRQRRPGGGAKRLESVNPEIAAALDRLIEPSAEGDPAPPLRWTCKSLRDLAKELKARGFKISCVTVKRMLEETGYTLQCCEKAHGGRGAPDRNAQFEHIRETSQSFMDEDQPVIFVDVREKRPAVGCTGGPEPVEADDVVSDAECAAPYGASGAGAGDGFVRAGGGCGAAEFIVDSISLWWLQMGKARYPDARSLYINAAWEERGGGDSLWKQKLRQMANRFGLTLHVSHFPTGTSKWNRIEHRMLSEVSMKGAALPLISHEVVVSLIAGATGRSGPSGKARRDEQEHRDEIRGTDAGPGGLNAACGGFLPEWNYVIRPRKAGV